MSCYRSKHFFE